jgi:hypothetical protein
MLLMTQAETTDPYSLLTQSNWEARQAECGLAGASRADACDCRNDLPDRTRGNARFWDIYPIFLETRRPPNTLVWPTVDAGFFSLDSLSRRKAPTASQAAK